MAGGSESFGVGGEDYWVLKLDANGNKPGCTLVADSHAVPADTHAVGVASQAQVKESSCTVTNTNASARISTGSSRTQFFGRPTPTPTDIPRQHRVRLPMVMKASGW